ncbi:hypothetical protein V1504DRAFT_457362 [Lipomyces starkeyi]
MKQTWTILYLSLLVGKKKDAFPAIYIENCCTRMDEICVICPQVPNLCNSELISCHGDACIHWFSGFGTNSAITAIVNLPKGLEFVQEDMALVFKNSRLRYLLSAALQGFTIVLAS